MKEQQQEIKALKAENHALEMKLTSEQCTIHDYNYLATIICTEQNSKNLKGGLSRQDYDKMRNELRSAQVQLITQFIKLLTPVAFTKFSETPGFEAHPIKTKGVY